MDSSGFPKYLGLQYEWVKEDRAAYPSQQPIPPFLAAIGSRYRYISSCSSSIPSRKFYWLINVTWCRSGWEMRLGIRWDSKGKLCYNSCCLCLSITSKSSGLEARGLVRIHCLYGVLTWNRWPMAWWTVSFPAFGLSQSRRMEFVGLNLGTGCLGLRWSISFICNWHLAGTGWWHLNKWGLATYLKNFVPHQEGCVPSCGPLQYWDVHLCPIGLEYLIDFSLK